METKAGRLTNWKQTSMKNMEDSVALGEQNNQSTYIHAYMQWSGTEQKENLEGEY